MTGRPGGVYQDGMRQSLWFCTPIFLLSGSLLWAEDLPLTRNVPIPDFQNRTESPKPYNFDAPPEGMFRHIVLAEGFDEELGFQRTHEIVPVRPTEQFPAGSSPEFTNRATNTIVAGLKGMLAQVFLCYVWPELPRGQAASWAPANSARNSGTFSSNGIVRMDSGTTRTSASG